MRRNLVRLVLVVLAPLCACLFSAWARADVQESVGESITAAAEDEQQQQRRQTTFEAGVLLLIGVTTIGLLLIAAAIVWGAKIRRMVRRPESPASRQDALWYLRKPSGQADGPSTSADDSTDVP